MKSCKNECAGCGGCGKAGELELTAGEIEVLRILGQIPFLPVARRACDEVPVCFELPQESVVLQCLQKRGLIDFDYTAPLAGCDYSAYADYPVCGSMALTARGLQALEILEIWGAE